MVLCVMRMLRHATSVVRQTEHCWTCGACPRGVSFHFAEDPGGQPGSDPREGRQDWGSNTEITGWPEGQTGSWKPKPVPPVGGVGFR